MFMEWLIGLALATLVTSLIKGGASLGGAAIENAQQQRITEENMEFEHNLNLSDWYRQNEYNLPTRQVERYRDAGASPSAAIQAVTGGSNALGATLSSTNSNPPNLPSFDLANSLQGLSQFPNLMNESRETSANVAFKEAQARYYSFLTDRGNVLLPHEVKEINSKVLKNYSDIKHNEALSNNLNVQSNRLSMLLPYEVREYQQETVKWIQNLEKGRAEIENLKKDLQVKDSQIVENYASASELEARAGLEEQEKDTEVYKTYQAKVESLAANARECVLKQLHIDPESPIGQQLIQSYCQGESMLIDYLSALDNIAMDIYGEMENKHKGLVKAGKIYGGLKLYDAWRTKKSKLITQDIGNMKDVLQMMMMFNPGSVVGGAALPASMLSDDWFDYFSRK